MNRRMYYLQIIRITVVKSHIFLPRVKLLIRQELLCVQEQKIIIGETTLHLHFETTPFRIFFSAIFGRRKATFLSKRKFYVNSQMNLISLKRVNDKKHKYENIG